MAWGSHGHSDVAWQIDNARRNGTPGESYPTTAAETERGHAWTSQAVRRGACARILHCETFYQMHVNDSRLQSPAQRAGCNLICLSSHQPVSTRTSFPGCIGAQADRVVRGRGACRCCGWYRLQIKNSHILSTSRVSIPASSRCQCDRVTSCVDVLCRETKRHLLVSRHGAASSDSLDYSSDHHFSALHVRRMGWALGPEGSTSMRSRHGGTATAQDGVVLRWCGERGWKLRGSTGLASSILVAVVDFLGRASNLRTEYTHTSDGLTNAPTPTSTCATNAWEPLLLGGA